MSRIGENIKKARTEQNIPIKQLAKKCGVSESYLADVESGKRVLNDSMIKTISKALNISISEPLFAEDELPAEEEVKQKTAPKTAPSAEWQSAFSSILKDVPIYNIGMDNTTGYISLPIVGKKVCGYNAEKLIYLRVPDNSMGGFRLKKDDLVMVLLTAELSGSGLYLVGYGDIKAIRHIKRLDSNNVLIVSHSSDIKTETMDIHDIKIIGRCIKAEIDLTNI